MYTNTQAHTCTHMKVHQVHLPQPIPNIEGNHPSGCSGTPDPCKRRGHLHTTVHVVLRSRGGACRCTYNRRIHTHSYTYVRSLVLLTHTYTHTHTHTHISREWYEPQAMMLSEDAVVVCGLLMGLNALDYNVMISGEDFDKSVSQ